LRFEHSFKRLTLYFEGGFGNSVPDSKLVTALSPRCPFVAHLEEGVELELGQAFFRGWLGLSDLLRKKPEDL
jgi:hypothetical protein